MKINTIVKGLLALVICLITHAVVLGMSPNFFSLYVIKIGGHTGGYSLKNYAYGIQYALFLLTFSGIWALYIPAFLLFDVLTRRLKIISQPDQMVTGVFVSIVYCIPAFLLQTKLGPNAVPWVSFLSAGLIGFVYSIMYYNWFSQDIN